MKIFGIGTDIVELKRFEFVDVRKLAKRIVSCKEYNLFEESRDKALFLAKRFCIKEAVSKAFGVGIGKNLSFLDISILKEPNGRPVCIVDEAKYLLITEGRKIIVHVSVSDTKTIANAYCIVELL